MLNFTKMQALGNDFVIIDATSQIIELTPSQITKLCHRHLGIGCDQLIIIQPGVHADFYCTIYNSDGSKAEQCGNGLRCIAKYLYEKKITSEVIFSLETIAGIFKVKINENDVEIKMGSPSILDSQFPMIDVDNRSINLSHISIGNPHVILQVEHYSSSYLNQLVNDIYKIPKFSAGVNIGFMQIINKKQIKLLTHERGVGFTLACGSNACAAAVAGIKDQLLNNEVNVQFELGSLIISYDPQHNSLNMRGPAEFVFSGIITS